MDVDAIIQKLVGLGWIRLGKITGNYQTIYCPVHNGGNERRPSCGILLKDEYRAGTHYPAGFTHCFTCGLAKTLPELVEILLKSHNVSQSSLEWLKENIPGFDPDEDFEKLIPANIAEGLMSKYAIQSIQNLVKKAEEYVSEEELASYRYVIPYMYERKLTDDIIEQYDVGYDANFIPPGRKRKVPCITFPVRDREGHTLFFCRRSVEGKMFNYPEGVVKPVYGIDQIPYGCSSIIICESCINALTCVSWGFHAVALLGTCNTYQIRQLRELGCPEFVLCFDGDEAGHRATKRLKRGLSDIAFVWSVTMPDGKDVNNLDKDEFLKLYAQKE